MAVKLVVVAGTFDCKGGRPSKLARSLIDVLRPWKWVNGGDVSVLMQDQIQIDGADAVIWMPKVDNAEPKGARRIKDRFPHVLLVTSKENYDGRYGLPDLVAHALSLKSNLLIEISGQGRRLARLIDPLGNVWEETSYFDRLARTVMSRLTFLSELTRVGSVRLADLLQVDGPEKGVQLDEPFFNLVRRHADRFHALIQPPPGMTRFLGNATFRCTHGFPAYRVSHGNGTWCLCVSRRNVDKRLAGAEMFVPVEPTLGERDGRLAVLYHGPHKPSVDTPVMVKLFQRFPEARYAMHGHVYVKGAQGTGVSLPCGCLEEYDAIAEAERDGLGGVPFVVNLQGHGFLALADSLEFLDGLEYVARPAWERGQG